MARRMPPVPPANRSPKGPQGGKPGEKRARADKSADYPSAGPHARRDLTNPMSTPGAGALPDPDNPDDDAQESTSG